MEKNTTSDRRAEIVDVTTRLFLETGFSGTSMSAVASACGITKATLYHHFKSKDDLFAACITQGYASALDDLNELVEDTSISPSEKLTSAVERLYESIVRSQVGRMSPLIAEVSRTFPSVAGAFHGDYIAPQQDLLKAILAEGIDKGDFKEVDQEVFFHMLLGPIVTLSLSLEMFASFDDLEEHFDIPTLMQGHCDLMLTWVKATI